MNFLTLYVLFTLHNFIKLRFGTFFRLDITPLYTYIMLLCNVILHSYSPLFIICTYVTLHHDSIHCCIAYFCLFCLHYKRTKPMIVIMGRLIEENRTAFELNITNISVGLIFSILKKIWFNFLVLNFKQTCHIRS